MKLENIIGDVVAITASLVGFAYVFGLWRMVRPASRVVLLAAGSTPDDGGLYGYYVSTDAGTTFTQQCCEALAMFAPFT